MKAPALTVAAAVVALAVAGSAHAGLAQQQALAERYAPVVRLVAGDGSCGPDSRYVPIDVDPALRSADGRTARPVGQRSRRDRADGKGARKGALRLPPRLPGRRPPPRLRLPPLARAPRRRADADDVRPRGDRSGPLGEALAPVLVLLRLQRLEQPARRRLGDDPARLRRIDGRGGVAAATCRGRLQPARRSRARDLGRPEAAEGRRNSPGRSSRRGLARELLQRGAVPRQLGLGGRWLRRHARPDGRRPAEGRDDPQRHRCRRCQVSVDRLRGALG